MNVIIINGPMGVGKTTVGNTLQTIIPAPPLSTVTGVWICIHLSAIRRQK